MIIKLDFVMSPKAKEFWKLFRRVFVIASAVILGFSLWILVIVAAFTYRHDVLGFMLVGITAAAFVATMVATERL